MKTKPKAPIPAPPPKQQDEDAALAPLFPAPPADENSRFKRLLASVSSATSSTVEPAAVSTTTSQAD